METDVRRDPYESAHRRRSFEKSEENESGVQKVRGPAAGVGLTALLGAGIAALAIIGLAGAAPVTLETIAVLATGVAMLVFGLSVAPRFKELVESTPREDRPSNSLAGGLGVFTVVGAGVTALGILALVGVASRTLTQIGVIAAGAGFLLGAPSLWALAKLRAGARSDEQADSTARSAALFETVVGAGGLALGILAVCGVASMSLNLIALIGYGAIGMVIGGASAYKLGRLAQLAGVGRHEHREVEEWRHERRSMPAQSAQDMDVNDAAEAAAQAERTSADAEKRAADAERRVADAERIAAEAEKRAAEAERRVAEAERRLAATERHIASMHHDRFDA